jgi:hypothetical protein
MTTPLAISPTRKIRVGRSVLAIAAAFIANAVLSLAVDQALHTLGVYPPWGQRMDDAAYLLAIAYRTVFGVAAGYLVARLAPSEPVRHAVILGVIGTAMSAIGVVVGITHPELGPVWYPIALLILTYPSIRLGAAWHEWRAGASR